MELLDAWQSWEKAEPPYVLEEDAGVLANKRSLLAIERSYTRWEDVYSADTFGQPNDRKLHLGLVPHPFCGDLLNAQVYLLMLNPLYTPNDYYAELESSDYAAATEKNLKQTFTEDDHPFFLLDPQFSWTTASMWWKGKLTEVIGELAAEKNTSLAEERHFLSKQVASLELIPYHSTKFKNANNWIRNLASARKAREFVHDYVIPKAKAGDAIIVATRQVNVWDLPDHPNITKYTAAEAHGAHLTKNSRGGEAILKQLLK
jgi:hypothetical protein